MKKDYPAIVIPAYQPDEQLLLLIQELRKIRPTQPIIVVNDGSDPLRQKIFAAVTMFQVDVIHHPANAGKGRALKTAFAHYLRAAGEKAVGVVTADADGQHSVEDILAVSDALMKNPQDLYLGVRDFTSVKIPLRSQFGNTLTGFFFRRLSATALYDTQTGLRGVPAALLKFLLDSKANGYELEMEMLFLAVRKKIKIHQVPIQTIYLNCNAASHFNPLYDSLKIYAVVFRFLFSFLKKGRTG